MNVQQKIVHRKADPAKVRELAEEGYSQSTIAVLLGVSRERIRQICDRDGIATLSGKVDHDRREKLAQYAGADMTAYEAARLVGYNCTSGAAIFRAAGLTPPRKTTWADRYRECAEAGMTLTETARKYGHPVPRVWNECRRAGVKFHARHRKAAARHKWTDADRVALKARRIGGETIRQIADSFGVTISAIHQQIAKAPK